MTRRETWPALAAHEDGGLALRRFAQSREPAAGADMDDAGRNAAHGE